MSLNTEPNVDVPIVAAEQYAHGRVKRCEKIGEVSIDTGCLLLADPLVSDLHDPYPDTGLTRQLVDHYGRPFAVVASTGLGDGWYPVFAEFEEVDGSERIVVALHILCSPDYSFFKDPAFPDAAKSVAREEAAFLKFMNGDAEPCRRPARVISERSKKALTPAALEAMADLKAQRQDWLIYLRLLRLVTDEVQDPEQPDTRIGVVSRGQPLELQCLFPGLTHGQLRYRMKKLVFGGLLIRRRTANGYRLAIRFSSASKWRRVSQVSVEHFGWLRRPIQMSLPLDEVPPRKPVMPATLQAAA